MPLSFVVGATSKRVVCNFRGFQKDPSLAILANEALEVDAPLVQMRRHEFQNAVEALREGHAKCCLGIDAYLARLLKTLHVRSEAPPQALRLNQDSEGVPNFFIAKPKECDQQLTRRIAFLL